MSLWGNKCDLSISASQDNAQTSCPLEQLNHLHPNILIDNSTPVWEAIQNAMTTNGQPIRIDIILDNAGFELVSDLCLAEYLLCAGIAREVHFHVKAFQWFVSDVTKPDLYWTLDQYCASNSICMSKFGQLWKRRLENGSFKIEIHNFWTTPFPYNEMEAKAKDLHTELCASDFIFLKGDLNYRKLVGDLNWEVTTPFATSLRGFGPAPLCALRTLKSDTVTGLKEGQKEVTEELDKDWMIGGNWAVISYTPRL